MGNWYAVHAKSHCEAGVVSHLTKQTITAFLPLIEVVRRYSTRRVSRLEPLFPGYLFVQLGDMRCDPSPWSIVRWTPGVKSILGADASPAPIPDGVIDAIKSRVQELGFVRPGPRFGPNDRVLIRRGPLARLEAVFQRGLSESGRVVVLMDLLGQARRVQVDEADLEPA